MAFVSFYLCTVLACLLPLQSSVVKASPIFSSDGDKPTPFRYTFRVERVEFGDPKGGDEPEEYPSFPIPDCEDYIDNEYYEESDEDDIDGDDFYEDEDYITYDEEEEYPSTGDDDDDEEDEEYPGTEEDDDEEEEENPDIGEDDDEEDEENPDAEEDDDEEEENPDTGVDDDEEDEDSTDAEEDTSDDDYTTEGFPEDNEVYPDDDDDDYYDEYDEYDYYGYDYPQDQEEESSYTDDEIVSIPSVNKRQSHKHREGHVRKHPVGHNKAPFPTWMPSVRRRVNAARPHKIVPDRLSTSKRRHHQRRNHRRRSAS